MVVLVGLGLGMLGVGGFRVLILSHKHRPPEVYCQLATTSKVGELGVGAGVGAGLERKPERVSKRARGVAILICPVGTASMPRFLDSVHAEGPTAVNNPDNGP